MKLELEIGRDDEGEKLDGAVHKIHRLTQWTLVRVLIGAFGVMRKMSRGKGRSLCRSGVKQRVPARFQSRNLYIHNASVTLMPTTPEECAEIGRITAIKLSRAHGPVTVLIPLLGVSAIDKFGGPFYSQEALNAYRRALEAELDPTIRLIEFDAHINDEIFACVAAQLLMELLRGVTETKAMPAL